MENAGRGENYRARDVKHGRLVSVRLLPSGMTTGSEEVGRAIDEARAVCAPSHPHICTIHEAGAHEGRQFLVTEIAEGETLEELVARGTLDIQVVLDFGVQIADALHTAHSRGIAHGALEAACILVTEGEQIKVMEFGLARLSRGAAEATPAGDIRALGALLEAMVAGEPLSDLTPILERARAAGGPGGYADAAEMGEDLTRAMTAAAPEYVPPPPDPEADAAAEEEASFPWRVVVGGGVVLAAVAIVVWTCA
jgi:serine/threonine protein kinase